MLHLTLWPLYHRGKNFGTQRRGGMVGPKAGLERRKCPPTGIRNLMHQIRSNNRLRYVGIRVGTAVGLRECACSACVWKNYGKTKFVTVFEGSAGNQRGYFANKIKSTVSSENQPFRLLNILTRSQQNTSNVSLFSSFRRVSIVICSFSGNSPAPEF